MWTRVRFATAQSVRRLATAQRLWRVGGWPAVLARLRQLRRQNAALAASALRGGLRAGGANEQAHGSELRTGRMDRLAALEEYTQARLRSAERAASWVPKLLDGFGTQSPPIRTVAFYLPQFHPIPENDAWWGKGFTEWVNVTRAQPQFVGHYQPHLPDELGFYDLRVPQVLQRQVELARTYGLSAFCFHYYWFAGKRLLDLPLKAFLADRSLQIGFCLCWANENWTRRWDGLDSEILIGQDHSPQDDIAFFDSVMPAFADPRYLRIDSKPIMLVYRASLLPDAAATAQRWREQASQRGLPGVYLVAVRSFELADPRRLGFDAAVEFPPLQFEPRDISRTLAIVNPEYKGRVFDYRELARAYGSASASGYTCFKAVMPGWDNEARRSGRGHTFIGSEPEAFARWLDAAGRATLERRPEERLLFINAWNEWAEGAHLEPDRRYGYGHLHAMANVLRNLSAGPIAQRAEEANRAFVKRTDIAIVLHLYYEDLVDELFGRYLDALRDTVDLFVTVPFLADPAGIDRVRSRYPNSYFVPAENRGRDMRPFLIAMREVERRGYRYACKVHTKKSPQHNDGSAWREALLAALLGSTTRFDSIRAQFESDPRLALLAPPASLRDLAEPDVHRGNVKWLDRLLARLGVQEQIGRYRFPFPAGSMYWFRLEALRPLWDESIVSLQDFELEAGQVDGTLAHAVERVVGCLASRQGWKMRELSANGHRWAG